MTVDEKAYFMAPAVCPAETNENFKQIRELTKEQESILATFREHIHNDATLTEKQRAFCTDACLQRYLRARDFHLKHAEALLRGTLKWRDEYKPDEISPYGAMDKEAETGKIFVCGHDLQGRPVVYMRPRFQNTTDIDAQNKQTIYTLERAIQSMDSTRGVETLALIIDYKGYSLRNAPPMSQSKYFLQLLSDHYPERLGIALMVDAPALLNMSYKVLQPLIPAETKKKIHFVHGSHEDGHHKQKVMARYFDIEQLPREYGGHLDIEYNHDKYWANEKAVWDSRHPQN